MLSHKQIAPRANGAIKRFLHWRRGDEGETWKDLAFKTLEKKLKKKSDDSFAKFIQALTECSPDTPCVTLDRSQDGRLQVSHRKMLPHVLSCRIARWPDLQTHQELKSVENCKYPGHQKNTDQVCINPYHYVRVEHPVYPPVLTPGKTSFPNWPSISSPTSDYYATSMSPQSFNGPQAPYWTAVSPGAQSFESQTPSPGYHDTGMELDTRAQLSPNTMTENPFCLNSNIWCKITYWELSSRVGEPFTASSPTVTIDGFTDPTNQNQRFSLGSLSNINRNIFIERIRKAIGKGVRIERYGTEVWAKNLSERSVFFQSKNHNAADPEIVNQLSVIRIDHNCHLKIFDFKVFEELVSEAMQCPENSYEKVMTLNSHCSIKMSFVKGWGDPYRSLEVTSTPCWLEIILFEPLAYLDTKMREFGPPNYHITSTS